MYRCINAELSNRVSQSRRVKHSLRKQMRDKCVYSRSGPPMRCVLERHERQTRRRRRTEDTATGGWSRGRRGSKIYASLPLAWTGSTCGYQATWVDLILDRYHYHRTLSSLLPLYTVWQSSSPSSLQVITFVSIETRRDMIRPVLV